MGVSQIGVPLNHLTSFNHNLQTSHVLGSPYIYIYACRIHVVFTGRRTWDKNMAKIKQMVAALRSETPNLRRRSSTKSQPSSTPRRSAGGSSASKTRRVKSSGGPGDIGGEDDRKTKKSSNSALAIVDDVKCQWTDPFFQAPCVMSPRMPR